jgi:DNA-binding MarR family transcriptional regulator
VQLVPTERGDQLFARLRERRQRVLHQIFSDWPEADIAELRRLTCKFNDGIESLYEYRGVQ